MDTDNFYTRYLICGFIHPVLPEVENRCLHGQGFPTSCSAVLLLTACSLAWWSIRWALSQCSWVAKCNLGRAEGESLNSLSYRQYVQPACCTSEGDQRLSTGEQNGLLSDFRFCWSFFFKLKKIYKFWMQLSFNHFGHKKSSSAWEDIFGSLFSCVSCSFFLNIFKIQAAHA